ncbi:MAG: hypothetical protein D6734_05640 [Candidatus Schekmanbacteria bacterium]|nr:MAG: hypothetical protein D6734_05640 [Candidatus Schekmanbacteria bacterium]
MLSQIGILLTLFASLTIAISIIQKRNEDRALLSLSLLSVSIILLDKTIPNLIDNMIVKNSFVQFFFIPLLSILCGRFFNKEKKFTIPMILATILAITTASMHIINTPSKIEQSKIDDSNAIFYSLWQEYMPVYVKIIPKEKYDRPFGSLSGNIKLLREEFSPERRGIRVRAKKGGETIRLNIFYFPGWTVNIKESKIPIRIDDSGRMIAVIPEGVHFIKVFLSDTKIEKAAHIISYIALIFLFFIYIFKERFFLI